MIYDVERLHDARQELREIWQSGDARSRFSILSAVGKINDRLAIAPYTQGESRGTDEPRILFELPLRVFYRIERFGGTVLILHVWVVEERHL